MRIVALGSYTIDLLARGAGKKLEEMGLQTDWYIAPFGQYQQEILDPAAKSKAEPPDFVVLTLHAEEWIRRQANVASIVAGASRAYPGSSILILNAVLLHSEAPRFLEWNRADSKRRLLAQVNEEIARSAADCENIHILDVEGLALRHGSETLFDSRMHYLAKMEFSQAGTELLASEMAHALATLSGRRKKCLVLDLDNTLWGGVLGDDGIERIKLSSDGEGRAFYDFQRQILNLHDTGIILAVCSKNDEAHALEVIDNHPDMLLRREHLSAWRINWSDKGQNILELAREINIGADSIVFLDDSPHERELVRAIAPEVVVPDLPRDPSDYPAFLANSTYFETFALTREDSSRNKMYVQERERREFQAASDSLDDFLSSLGVAVTTEPATAFNTPRIAQLTQRTNQFNLTTRRYSCGDIAGMRDSDDWQVLALSASDKLGDSGLVGVAIVALGESTPRIDTFLMSCRVLGRGVEVAALSELLSGLSRLGYSQCSAEYVPSERNGMAKTFLLDNGFANDGEMMVIDLTEAPEVPHWIEVKHE